MAERLAGKVALVSGGARGMGASHVRSLVAEGAKVVFGDILDDEGKAVAAEVGEATRYLHLDVTKPEDWDAAVATALAEFGRIDVLVNNAGIMPLGRVVDESDAVTRRILDINVYGVILGSKLALARMIPRGRGHVINVASLAGETYLAGAATYCASKHAVVGFTDAARIEYRRSGVTFSVVKPTFVNTELIAGTSGAKGVRNAEPSDIADAIVKLVAHPRPRVRVTRTAGAIIASQKFMPRALSEGLNRLLGGEHVFTDAVDVEKRQAYEARARGEQ